MATATPSARGARTPQKQHAGLLELDAQPSAATIPSSSRERSAEGLPWGGELTFRTPARHRAPNNEPGRILIPGDGSSRGSRAQNRPAGRPAMAAGRTPAACPVSTTSWRYGLRRTCRLVTGRSHPPRSTRLNQARLALLAVTDKLSSARTISAD